MGTIAGDDGAGNQVGMAPGAKWIGCRNMNQGIGTPATYIECFEFFLAPYPVNGTPAQGDPDRAPDVSNNSWGCPASEGCSPGTLLAAVQAQRAAGILTVVSAGNSGSSCGTVNTPAAIYDESYSVGSHTIANAISSFSSRGPVTVDGSNRLKPDITAPGSNVRSSTRTSTTSYGSLSGTSMAGPHVAGAVALLWSAKPALRNDIATTEALFNDTAVHVMDSTCGSPTSVPNHVWGWGRLDVRAAVNKLALMSAVSRKVHGAAGTFDIPLPLAGNPGVEPRSSGSHTLVFTFNKPVASGNATVSEGSATAEAPIMSGNTMTVNLSGVTDVQRITVSLNGVTGTDAQTLAPTTVSMNVLAGDVNGSKVVTASDISAVKAQSGLPVTQANFRADVAVSGSVNATDIGRVKTNAGFAIP
jgi:subtilisin family serine protease